MYNKRSYYLKIIFSVFFIFFIFINEQYIQAEEFLNNKRLSVQGNFFREPNGKRFYVHGANLPWFEGGYGHDIGKSFLHPEWGVKYKSSHMRNYFEQMHKMNINTVRLFIFEELEGIQTDKNGKITGIDPTFLNNLDDILKIAHSLSIRLYLVILDGVYGHVDLEYEKSIFKNNNRLEEFQSAVISPLIKRYKDNDTIFAFDILNESNLEVKEDITWEMISNFIKLTSDTIHKEDKKRLVSCSILRFKDIENRGGRYNNLGLDFFDCHKYDDIPDLPNLNTLDLKIPVLLGEYGPKTGDEKVQAESTEIFLRQAYERGWAGSLIWAFDFPASKKEHRLMNNDGSWRKAAYILRDFKEK